MHPTGRVLVDESYAADPHCIGKARRAAGAAARGAGLREQQVWDVMLAVSEAVTNAVVHGFAGCDRHGHVRLQVVATEEAIVLTVEDDGVGVRPRADSPGVGLGLPTIATIATSFDLRHLDGAGTQLCFSFTRPRETAAAAWA